MIPRIPQKGSVGQPIWNEMLYGYTTRCRTEKWEMSNLRVRHSLSNYALNQRDVPGPQSRAPQDFGRDLGSA